MKPKTKKIILGISIVFVILFTVGVFFLVKFVSIWSEQMSYLVKNESKKSVTAYSIGWNEHSDLFFMNDDAREIAPGNDIRIGHLELMDYDTSTRFILVSNEGKTKYLPCKVCEDSSCYHVCSFSEFNALKDVPKEWLPLLSGEKVPAEKLKLNEFIQTISKK